MNKKAAEKIKEPRAAKILVVDDHPIVYEGLEKLFSREKDLRIAGYAEDSDGAIRAVEKIRPELVIVDISLAEGVSGLELIKVLRRRYPKLPVLVLSMHEESLYAERVIRSGARGYVMKNELTAKVVDAARAVLDGKVYLSGAMSSRLLDDLMCHRQNKNINPVDRLSDREIEVLRLVGSGNSSSDIAGKLKISIKTVETHRLRIREKLHLKNSVQLVKYAIEWTHGRR
ncbi:MAG: response regulator transcription factor [Spirochaetes bacterium]|jgi:DNA-binding NarL/FixJ family response regulator|nr:response regulator transcription factor [Spirochaetota bacterium]